MNNDACLYLRYSPRPESTNGEQKAPEDHDSLETQLERCSAYCFYASLNAVEVIRDPEVSARKIPLAERDGGKRLLALTTGKRPDLAHVVAYRLDRLFRNTTDGLITLDRWTRKGVTLHLAAEGGQSISTATATGKLITTILLARCEHEAGLTSERTRDGVRRKRRAGYRMGGSMTYGYATDPANPLKMVPLAEEQAVIARIMEWFGKGDGPYAIFRRLNDEGCLYRGKPWHRENVRRILRRAMENPA